jgi:cytochrome P450 family 9
MTELMTETGEQLVNYLITTTETELNIRELFRRFTADVIATTAYGTVFDSVNNPNNEFFKHANKVLDLKGLRGLVLAGYILSPKLMEILKIPLIPLKMKEYFFNIIFGSIRYREEQNKVC